MNRASNGKVYSLMQACPEALQISKTVMPVNSKLTHKQIKAFEVIYLLLFITSLLLFLAEVTFSPMFLANKTRVELLLTVCVLFGIYYGLRNIKNWVILLILLTGYWGLLNTFLKIVESQPTVIDFFVAKALGLLFFLFFAYQVLLFSKKETRDYFKTEGIDKI